MARPQWPQVNVQYRGTSQSVRDLVLIGWLKWARHIGQVGETICAEILGSMHGQCTELKSIWRWELTIL